MELIKQIENYSIYDTKSYDRRYIITKDGKALCMPFRHLHIAEQVINLRLSEGR